MKRWFYGILSLALIWAGLGTTLARPQATRYGTVSLSRARALAMGVAFMAVEDDLSAIGYNPGSFSLYQRPRAHRVTVFFNGIGPVVAIKDWSHLAGRRDLAARDVLGAIGLLIKGVAFSAGALDIGLLFGEQSLFAPETAAQGEAFDASFLLDNQSSWAVIRLKPADRVALGVAGSLISSEADGVVQHGYSLSYGILLRPARAIRIGVSYLNLSRMVAETRTPLERLVNDSVNFGLSVRPTASTTLAIDVRNVGEQQDEILSQAHFGIEQTLFSQLALRGGFYDQPEKDTYVITGGFGLFGTNTLFSADRRFGHPSFVLNYTFAYEAKGTTSDRWHLLSLVVRI